jgi:hypothetical protein
MSVSRGETLRSSQTGRLSTNLRTIPLLGLLAVLAMQGVTAQDLAGTAGAHSPMQMIHILHPGGGSAGGNVDAARAVDEVRPAQDGVNAISAGLIINPTFDLSITSDPNAAAIENAITTAIADIQSRFSDPITVNISFARMASGLGQNSTAFFNVPYATFLAALKADVRSGDDAAAVSLLSSVANNPVNGSPTINVKSANLRALGLGGTVAIDGTIGLNTTITAPGSPGSTGSYNLVAVVQHEIDEVLGLGSSLPSVSFSTIFPEDLYRYSPSGARTFTATDSRVSGQLANFSIDGRTFLAEFDNQDDGGDFGDWQSSPRRPGIPARVQDAFMTPGASPVMAIELTALDAIGYDRVLPLVPPSISVQPANQTIAVGSTATLCVTASGTAPLTFQWYAGASGSTGTPIGGATASCYTTPPLAGTSSYWVRVTNAAGSVDSSTATVIVITPPTITAQPTNQVVRTGQAARFSVTASGTAPSFQWQISTNRGGSWTNLSNGGPYTGVRTATLTVGGVTRSLNGLQYRCIATNLAGSATSSAATLTVLFGATLNDFDGDNKADLGVYRPSTGTWYIEQSATNYGTYLAQSWGLSTDIPVPGDYDGDGKNDFAVYRPVRDPGRLNEIDDTGYWYIKLSTTNNTTSLAQPWGLGTDIPVPGDYDGDGKADLAVYRPSSGVWYVLQSTTNYTTYLAVQWGISTDIPVPGDYDGDGKADLAVYRPSTGVWYVLQSTVNYTTYFAVQWGISTDIAVPGDYDGDGKTDLAVYRPSTGIWYVLQSTTNYTASMAQAWGLRTDIPVPGDYDGDGKTDLGLYRSFTGYWYVLLSSTNFTTYVAQQWGLSTDIPVPKHQ